MMTFLRRVLFSTLIFSAICFSINKVEAQTAKQATTWVCIKKDNVKTIEGDHMKEVKGVGFPKSETIYIVGCVATVGTGNYKCTTGNSTGDNTLALSRVNGYTFSSVPQPITTTTGDFSAKVQSIYPSDANMAFYGVYLGSGDVADGNANTLQQGTIVFDKNISNCISFHWDPEGRVFDSESLEPLPRTQVRLLNSNKQMVYFAGIVNPSFPSYTSGVFNFNIKDGGYFYLDPILPNGYTFGGTSKLNANFTKAYFDIYKQNDLIHELPGVVEHRDIPLDPVGSPYTADPSMISFGTVQHGNYLKISGQVSHPLTTVVISQKLELNQDKELTRVSADKFGFFDTFIEVGTISQFSPLSYSLIKVNLTTNGQSSIIDRFHNFLFGEVQAQTATQFLANPILPYIEGYVYDKTGIIIPNAVVNVKLQMSDKIYYQIVADKNGYFKINPQNLPPFNYYLEFLAPNSSVPVTYTTVGFTQANKKFLDGQKINLLTMTKNNQPIVIDSTGSSRLDATKSGTTGFAQAQIGGGQNQVDKTNPQSTNNPVQQSSNPQANGILFVVFTLMVLIVGVGGIIGLYLYKRNQGQGKAGL